MPIDSSVENHKKLDFLLQKIGESFDFYNKRRKNNKWKAFSFKMAVTSCAAFITILAGLNLGDYAIISKTTISIFILVLGGMTTVASAWDAFFDHKSLWVKYTDSLIRIHALKTESEFLKLDGADLEEHKIEFIFQQYKLILEEIGQSWVLLRQSTEDKKVDK